MIEQVSQGKYNTVTVTGYIEKVPAFGTLKDVTQT
jgi:hypothetical protein